jgi:hypothetical protein
MKYSARTMNYSARCNALAPSFVHRFRSRVIKSWYKTTQCPCCREFMFTTVENSGMIPVFETFCPRCAYSEFDQPVCL